MWNLSDAATVRHLSLEHARELAGEIASSYFGSGALPTDTLKKVAQSEELTPYQIELVAAEANKAIHAFKYASADEKYFAAEFPLADAKSAIGSLQLSGETKVAARFANPKPIGPEFDPFKAFGIEAPVLDKTAEVKGHLKTASVRGELLSQKLQDKAYMAKVAAQDVERSFIKQARQMALEGDSSAARLGILGGIFKFAKEGGLEQIVRPALAKVAYVLRAEGKLEVNHANPSIEFFLAKTADIKAPSELISEDLLGKVMVVNGQHPLYITLKTMEDYSKQRPDLDHQISVVDDKLQAVKQKIREL